MNYVIWIFIWINILFHKNNIWNIYITVVQYFGVIILTDIQETFLLSKNKMSFHIGLRNVVLILILLLPSSSGLGSVIEVLRASLISESEQCPSAAHCNTDVAHKHYM